MPFVYNQLWLTQYDPDDVIREASSSIRVMAQTACTLMPPRRAVSTMRMWSRGTCWFASPAEVEGSVQLSKPVSSWCHQGSLT